MQGGSGNERDRAAPRYDEGGDPDFQRRWSRARHLDQDQVELAFRHGFDARGRFADRPFREVESLLRQSWEGMGPPAPWSVVADIVRSGYERYKGAGLPASAELGPEALERFPRRTIGGSMVGGGVMGERSFLGASEPVSDFEGEGGPPVGGHEPPPAGPASDDTDPDVSRESD